MLNCVWMELPVMAVEAVAYARLFRRATTGRPIAKWVAPAYAAVANAASFAAGLLIASKLPGLFNRTQAHKKRLL